MTTEITGAPEPPASDPPDVLQHDGVQTQAQASDTTVLITEAEVALGTAAATGLRKDRRWVALLSRIFVPAPKAALPKLRPYQPRMATLGMVARLPVVFGVAGFAMVPR
jgi:hypothetical protein